MRLDLLVAKRCNPGMSADVALPKQLKIVGWIFVFIGWLALIQTLYTMFSTPPVNINFLIVFIFVGFGLLKRRQRWRSFANACSLVVLIFYLGNLLLVVTGKIDLTQKPMPIQVEFWVTTTLALAASGYALWALQSKEVREAFEGRY